jgi:serpin B
VSVYAALSLVDAGARGRTLSEMLGVLGAPSRDDLAGSVSALAEQALANRSETGGPQLNFACGVWHDETRTLKPAYIEAVVKDYRAQTCAADFHRKVSTYPSFVSRTRPAINLHIIHTYR